MHSRWKNTSVCYINSHVSRITYMPKTRENYSQQDELTTSLCYFQMEFYTSIHSYAWQKKCFAVIWSAIEEVSIAPFVHMEKVQCKLKDVECSFFIKCIEAFLFYGKCYLKDYSTMCLLSAS